MNQVAEKMFQEEEDGKKSCKNKETQIGSKNRQKRQVLVFPNPIKEVSKPVCGKDVTGGGRLEKKVAKNWLLKKMVYNQKKEMRPSFFQPNVGPKS